MNFIVIIVIVLVIRPGFKYIGTCTYLSTISTYLPSTCIVFKYFLLKVTHTCTCTESLSQVLKVLIIFKVLISN